MREAASLHVLNKIYTTSIQPVIDYAICSWGFTYEYNIKKVQRLQNFAGRIITGNFDYINSRGSDIIKTLGWMTVTQRRNYFTLLLMFKCVTGKAPAYMLNNVIMQNEIEQAYELRSGNSKNVIVPYSYSNKLRFSFNYNSAILWNQLPDAFKNISELCVFKYAIRNYVFNHM